MAEQVKLFGMWASPYSRRVELALKLKGIQYEYIEEDLSNKSPLLLKYNPVHKKIPVLVHNGKPIVESQVILEYIDETWKNNPILPQHPYDRAMARFWANFIEEKFMRTPWRAYVGTKEEQEQAREEGFELLKMLENELNGKDFFGGETIGYVDIFGFSLAVWHGVVREVFGVDLITENKFPVFLKWSRKFNEIDVVNECRPPVEKHIAYMRARIEAFKSATK
ncbi:hypothetical protein HS088_TW22G01052 [Tripterygium wilfordii]|uniref:glutathione transferase n=2 Tax=Tripterygium wilfordii TaxID=458696 RepID=A0A7J7BZM7_TRIWF|nr:hypothetical protein HS088_TW22G01052 [Tripterygium wilfordii]